MIVTCIASLLADLACDPTRTADVAAVIMHEGTSDAIVASLVP